MGFIDFPFRSVTGDCQNLNLGSFEIELDGSFGPWVIYEGPIVTGLLPTSAITTSGEIYFVDNLPSGNYTLTVVDSDSPTTTVFVPFSISSGVTLTVSSTGTTCGLNNGSVTGYTDSYSLPVDIYLYDISNNFIDSGSTTTVDNFVTFNNLQDGTYYVNGYDIGGCSGTSESCVVKPSTNFTFGYYAVDNASCVSGSGSGKIFITGLTTPTSAYTINWLSNVNGQTGTTVTGLTQGLYSVEITNQEGCTNVDYIQINDVQPIQILSTIVQPAGCFQPDGEVTVLIGNGTAPYYYSGSNNSSEITFNTTHTFTGLSAGLFSYSVTDSGLCTVIGQETLTTPNSFSSVDLIVTNSNCSTNNGIIDVYINNGVGNNTYTFTLSGTSGTYISNVVGGVYKQFASLGNGNYVIFVDDNSGCVYTGTTTIISTDKFIITPIIVGTTCGRNDGSLSVSVSSGATFPVNYILTGPTYDPLTIGQPNGNFTNLKPGNYTLTVNDFNGCQQSIPIFIASSNPLYFDFIVTNPVFGNDGEIDVLITTGEPPFTFGWSPNVSGQTGLVVTGLTNDVYSLTITDSNGCTYTRTAKLNGTQLLGNFSTYTICEKLFKDSGTVSKRGIKQMYNEGFYDLTSGDTNCIVDNATFILEVTIGEETKQDNFYTSTGLLDFPTDQLWGDTLKALLETFVGVGEVIVDFVNNKVTITNDCDEIEKNCRKETYNLLNDTRVVVNLIIQYNIACVECG